MSYTHTDINSTVNVSTCRTDARIVQTATNADNVGNNPSLRRTRAHVRVRVLHLATHIIKMCNSRPPSSLCHVLRGTSRHVAGSLLLSWGAMVIMCTSKHTHTDTQTCTLARVIFYNYTLHTNALAAGWLAVCVRIVHVPTI